MFMINSHRDYLRSQIYSDLVFTNPFSVNDYALESIHQKAFFQFCAMASYRGVDVASDKRSYTGDLVVGELLPSGFSSGIFSYFYAITLNQANGISGLRAKAMGAKKGYPDVALDVARLGFNGLRIEFKNISEKSKNEGGLKPEQVMWRDHLVSNGYKHAVCYGWIEAVTLSCEYLGYYSGYGNGTHEEEAL